MRTTWLRVVQAHGVECVCNDRVATEGIVEAQGHHLTLCAPVGCGDGDAQVHSHLLDVCVSLRQCAYAAKVKGSHEPPCGLLARLPRGEYGKVLRANMTYDSKELVQGYGLRSLNAST